MTALEFIKKFGWGSSKDVINGWIRKDFDDSYHISEGVYCNLPFEPTDDCGTISLFELKQYVEAWELVQSYGGVDGARKVAHKDPFDYHNQWGLLKAIAIVEQVNENY